MLRKLALSFLLIVCTIAVSNFSFATTITYNGGPISDYTLVANDTLYIASGTYTGTVSGLNANNRTIIVAGGATFQPTLLQPTNGVVCKMHIYGTFTYNQPLTTNTNFTIDVYAGGVMNLTNTMDTKGRDQVWTNQIGGTMNFTGDVTINGGTAADDNNVFINYETVNATGNFIMRSGSNFINYKNFTVSGSYTANGGILNNQGNFIAGSIDMNSGASQIINYCRMESTGNISLSNGNFSNYTYVWARNSTLTITGGAIFNNIRIPQASPPMVHARNLTLSSGGLMNGPALLYFQATTNMTGGTIGVSGVTSDTIKVNELTRTGAQIFDVQSGGTINPNVIYNVWGAPDSLVNYMFGCSFEIFQLIPLAITWNHFYVSLSNNIPVLYWSAEYESGVVFEIQRSYDGANFQSIKNLPSDYTRAEYTYNDALVNTQRPVAFYRIKAIGLNGGEKYSQIRTVRFRNSHGVSLYISPNPFTSNFIIDYTATDKEMITVRIFNVNGQQQLVKNFSVNKGDNIINVTEAARLSGGIYVVQVSNDHTVLSTSKIVKR